MTRKTQSSTTIDNITHKRTNNSVADVLSRVSPLPHRSTDVRPEDVTPLHVLSDSIPANQSCLDSVQTEAKKDGTLQQPRNCQATQSTRCSQKQEGLSQYEVTIFSEYGLPEELVSGQGSQFTNEQYTSFAKEHNIRIAHSSPGIPSQTDSSSPWSRSPNRFLSDANKPILIHT